MDQTLEESLLQKATMENTTHTVNDLGILKKLALNSCERQSTRMHRKQQRNLTKMDKQYYLKTQRNKSTQCSFSTRS